MRLSNGVAKAVLQSDCFTVQDVIGHIDHAFPLVKAYS
jgi:hypothetical protein